MIKYIFILFAMASAATLNYNEECDSLKTADSLNIDYHLKYPTDSIQSVLNGAISNINLKSTATFSQHKIDSVKYRFKDWIYNYTRRVLEYNGANIIAKSKANFTLKINDSSATDTFKIYSDSTIKLIILTHDSAFFYPVLKCSTSIKAVKAVFDSIKINGYWFK